MRRVGAVLGVLLLVGGVVAAVVLLVLGPRYRERQIDQMARAAVGCTTPLVFTGSGEFFVFEEVVTPDGADPGSDVCPPTPGEGSFRFEFVGDTVPAAIDADTSVSYDAAGALGTARARITIDRPGTYRIDVRGPLADSVATIGPDPNAIADDYRRAALIVGIGGVVLGLLLVVAAGRRPSGAAQRTDGGAEPPLDGSITTSPWGPPTSPPVA